MKNSAQNWRETSGKRDFISLKRFLYILICALILFLLLASAGLTWAWYRNDTAHVIATELDPDRASWHPGAIIECRMTVEVPWYMWPAEAELVTPGSGLQVIKQPTLRINGIGWGVWSWTVSGQVQPYDLGVFQGPQLTARISRIDAAQADILTAEFEDVTVKSHLEQPANARLSIAPRIAEAPQPIRHNWIYWLGLGLLLALILMTLLAILLRKEGVGAVAPPSPENVARRQLAALQKELPMEPDRFFVRLTDTIRWYLETRLGLTAAGRTTSEFLQELHQQSSLSETERSTLATFLTMADMVKFARQSATVEQMHAALQSGHDLINAVAAKTAPRSSSALQRDTQAAEGFETDSSA